MVHAKKSVSLCLLLSCGTVKHGVSAYSPASVQRQQQKRVPILAKSCRLDDIDNVNTIGSTPSFHREVSRRKALLNFAAFATTTTTAASFPVLLPQPALAAEETATTDAPPGKIPISASWKAVDGLNSNDNSLVAFDESAYKAMVNDAARTPFFEKAIIQRLNSAPGGPDSQTVIDLGTGPYALFAIIAAQNGAGTVYAIESNPEVARSARATVKKAGFDDVITVIDGLSSDITLPNNEKADFVVAEIIGSVASEEGVYATMVDAHQRLVKEPSVAANWIPSRVQTFAAPASYSLHNLFGPPAFDWDKLKGEPVRFNCKDMGLQLLSTPVVLEDIKFSDISGKSGGFKKLDTLKFTIDGDRIEDNTPAFVDEFRLGRLDKPEAQKLAQTTARSFTGIAMWPRLILDANDKIIVNSRAYPDGDHQKSHWQTVLPIMSATPVSVKAGDEVVVNVDFDVPATFQKAATYKLAGNVIRK